jgi:hypothetical protein
MLIPVTIPDFTPFFKPLGSILWRCALGVWQVVMRPVDLRVILGAEMPNGVSESRPLQLNNERIEQRFVHHFDELRSLGT